jgi:ABC-type glycerol-3-phosphate transport system substrate-binding protein
MVHGNIHFGGVDFVEDDTIVAYFEEKFNCDLELIRSADWTGTINMMVASGEIPDIMHQAGDRNNQLYKDLRAADALADFMEVAAANPGAFPKLMEVTQDEWAKKIFSENDGASYFMLPRDYGLWPHAFYVRADWLEKLNLPMPTTLDELYSTLETVVAADPDGMDTTGIVVPGTWALDHILAGFNGTGATSNWIVQDGKYIRAAVAESTREAYRFLHRMYENNLLDREVFTGSQDIALGKFINGQAAVIIIDFTFATNIETGLLQLYPNAKLDVLPPDLQGPNHMARTSGSRWYQAVAVSSKSVDVTRCYAILEYILSDEGQDILARGIEGVHYTVANGTVFKNIELFKHEMWGLEGYQTMHRLRAPISLTQVYNPDYYVNKNLVNNFFGVLNTLDDKVAMDALLGKTLDTVTEVGSLPGDIASEWFADFVMGNKDLDTDWDEYVAAYYASGYDRIEAEANEKYKP